VSSGGALIAAPARTTTTATAQLSVDTTSASTVVVKYGTTATDLNKTALDATVQRNHRISLPAASAGDQVYYRITAIDTHGKTTTYPAAGTAAASATVPANPTPPPPAIRNVSADPLPDGSVSVVWETDQPTDGKVLYGTASGALTQTRFGSGRDTRHAVLLSQMPRGRRYYYEAISRNAAGRKVRSAIRSFDVPAFGVADSRKAQWRTGNLRSGMSIGGSDGGDLTLASGHTSGAYRSRLLDAGQMVTWRIARWRARLPMGAKMVIAVRTGSTSTPDDSWTRWVQIDASGQRIPARVRPSRYLQYRVRMTAGRVGSPVLHSIGFTTSGRTPPSDDEIG
jgi:hypothetical protein